MKNNMGQVHELVSIQAGFRTLRHGLGMSDLSGFKSENPLNSIGKILTQKMESLKEYVKNIDFDIVDDSEVLYNVYKEIHGHEGELILNTETTYQIENLIRKSNADQILTLFKRLDIKHLINKKLGSRVLEVVYDTIFSMLYVDGQDIDIKVLVGPTEEFMDHRILDENATHVIRKLFQLVSGRRITKDKVERFSPADPAYIEKYKTKIVEIIPRLSREDGFVTLLYYLRCYRSQSVIYEVIGQHFSWMKVCEPTMSYFFENLVKLAGKKTLKRIFEEVKDRVMDLCKDRYANYFIGELMLQYYDEADYFFDAIDLSEFGEHSNVIMKLVQALQKVKSYRNINKIMRNFYLKSDEEDAIISSTFGGVEGNFKQKYAPMLCGFMKLPEEHSYGINSAFKRRFSSSWLRSKGGIELLEGYYEGIDSNASKREFTRRLGKHLASMTKRRECISVLKLMMKYTDSSNTKFIRQELMKQGRKGQHSR